MAKTRKKQASVIGRAAAVILGLLVLAVVVLGAAWGTGFALTGEPNPTKWNVSTSEPNTDTANGVPTNGMTVSTYSTDNINVYATPMVASLDARMDSTFYLSATVEPADADFQNLIWEEVKFLNPSSAWAQGKNAADFVGLKPTSDTHNAVLTCLGSFGEPIIVTTRSEANPEVYATCRCDYVKRVKSINFTLSDPTFTDSFGYTYDIEPTAYTVDSDFKITSAMCGTLNDFAANVISRVQYNGWDLSEDIYANSNRPMHIDTEAQTLRFEKDKPNCLFYIDTGNEDGHFYGYSTEALQPVNALIDTAFRQAVKAYSGYHIIINISYSITCNGESYGGGSETLYVNFNYDTIKVPVSNIRLSEDNILM